MQYIKNVSTHNNDPPDDISDHVVFDLLSRHNPPVQRNDHRTIHQCKEMIMAQFTSAKKWVPTYACEAASLDRGGSVSRWSFVEDTLLFEQDSHLNYCLQDNLGEEEREREKKFTTQHCLSLPPAWSGLQHAVYCNTEACTSNNLARIWVEHTWTGPYTLQDFPGEVRRAAGPHLTHKHNRALCSQKASAPLPPWLGLT